ncbi:hypothetical protein O6H91_20G006100 [Diphasiastrum complanatum]|uniref:Uncharacterized protein n=1 Tax=Diphasiastrum complanatum TaxID=34168 RepID=A0ACC2AMK0_DIPCM|nr:hypothetical protein O6H91_20G006100 [Diphasiastrum complanatum]
MDVAKLQQQHLELTQALFKEGFLDEQFTQLQQLEDPSNPEFVAEVSTLFFDDSQRILAELTKSLDGDPVDFKKIDAYVHQFKGSSSSIGAHRVKVGCTVLRTCCEEENREGCWQALQQVKQEFFLVKNRLELLLQLEQQILAEGGTIPFME